MATETAPALPRPSEAACNDPGRLMFYERVGRYFYDDAEAGPFAGPLPCAVCGEPLTSGVVVGKLAFCVAQRAITAKRLGPSDPPGKKGANAFNDLKKAVLVTPGKTYVIVNVKPLKPLPDDVAWRPDGSKEAFAELYRAIYEEGVSVPALYVEFGRSGGIELVLTESPDMPVRCGGEAPEYIDAGRVRQVAAALRAIGFGGLKRFSQLRRRLQQPQGGTRAEQDEYMALVDAMAEAGVDPAQPPTHGEPAYQIASILTGTETENEETRKP